MILVTDDLGDSHAVYVLVQNQADAPLAVDDTFEALAWTPATITNLWGIESSVGSPGELVLDVLQNDSVGADIATDVRIVEVRSPDHGGTVRLITANDDDELPPWVARQSVLYSAPPDFSGEETFVYVIEDAKGLRAEATATVQVQDMPGLIHYRIEPRDVSSELVDTVRIGDQVDLYVYAAEHSGREQGGIFSADVSVTFDPDQLLPLGDVQFGADLPNGHSISIRTDWLDSQLRVVALHAFGGIQSTENLDVLVARIPMQVVSGPLVQVGFRAENSSPNLLRSFPAGPVPFSSMEFTGAVMSVVSARHNSELPVDVNGDGHVTPMDVLIVVNELNENGGQLASETAEAEAAGQHSYYCDVNNDGYVTPLDALGVINILNDPVAEAEGEAARNLPRQLIVDVEPIATAQETPHLTAFSPGAATDSDTNVQRPDDVFSPWATPTVEDELLDWLAIDSKGHSTDGDAQMDDVIDLLSADALRSGAIGDSLSLL
jgi:hypothetical protein